jgi:hypothetical protein
MFNTHNNSPYNDHNLTIHELDDVAKSFGGMFINLKTMTASLNALKLRLSIS